MASLDAALARIDSNQDAALKRLFALISIKSISTDSAYAGDCLKAAEWLAAELKGLGFEASVRPTACHPMVVAEAKATQENTPHVLFYGHYDVQPPDPLDLWESPPFEPRLANAPTGKQIVGRGTSDDKGQLMTFVEACRAFKETGGLPCDITILLEGEEETGSPSLPAFLAANRAELKADMALACDTAMWDRTTPAVSIMLRGLVLEEVVIKGADRDLHSGMFGGPAINPIHVLALIIADLHDEAGRVTLPGFYDGVTELPREIAEQWRELPFDGRHFLEEVGLSVPAGETGRSVLEMIWSRPTCDVNGIIGGYTGKGSKTVLPAQASAKFSFRLVGNAGPGENRGELPQFCEGASAGRLPRRIPLAWCLGRAAIALRLGGADTGAQGLARGMGQGRRAGRLRRLDSDRRRVQTRSRHGHADDRLRARRRPHPFAQREVRALLAS